MASSSSISEMEFCRKRQQKG